MLENESDIARFEPGPLSGEWNDTLATYRRSHPITETVTAGDEAALNMARDSGALRNHIDSEPAAQSVDADVSGF